MNYKILLLNIFMLLYINGHDLENKEGQIMSDKKTTINDLKEKVAQFTKERNWDQFHSPKNLAMSIAIEAAELMEKFQWVDSEKAKDELKKNKEAIEQELADITAYILSFCHQNEIDLSDAIERKLEINRKKYPVNSEKKEKNEIIEDYYERKRLSKSKNN